MNHAFGELALVRGEFRIHTQPRAAAEQVRPADVTALRRLLRISPAPAIILVVIIQPDEATEVIGGVGVEHHSRVRQG